MYRALITLLFLTTSQLLHASKKSPIIFVHGLAAHPKIYEKNDRLRELFEDKGYEFHVADIPSMISLKEHSLLLYNEIKKIAPTGSFHLIAHSMGGIISRKVINDFKLDQRCLSLTTLSTPHRGSVIADWAMEKLGKSTLSNDEKSFLAFIFGDSIDAIPTLTTKYMTKYFNLSYPNSNNVKYYSMGFFLPHKPWQYTKNPFILYANKLQKKRYNIYFNDGLVSIQSSLWGNYLGSYKGDHISQTVPLRYNGERIFEKIFTKVIKNLDINFK